MHAGALELEDDLVILVRRAVQGPDRTGNRQAAQLLSRPVIKGVAVAAVRVEVANRQIFGLAPGDARLSLPARPICRPSSRQHTRHYETVVSTSAVRLAHRAARPSRSTPLHRRIDGPWRAGWPRPPTPLARRRRGLAAFRCQEDVGGCLPARLVDSGGIGSAGHWQVPLGAPRPVSGARAVARW